MSVPFETRKGRYTLAAIFLSTLLLYTAAATAEWNEDDFWSDDQPPPVKPMTTEDAKQIIEEIRLQDPGRADRLKQILEKDLDQFKKALGTDLPQPKPDTPAPGKPPKTPPAGMEPPGQAPPRGHGPGQPEPPRQGQREEPERWREQIQKRHQEYFSWLEKNFPEEALRLKEIRDKKPQEYFHAVITSRRTYGPIMDAQEQNPPLAVVLREDLELKELNYRLVQKIHAAKTEEKSALTAQLRDVVEKRFDLIVCKKKLQYQQLRNRLEKMQTELKNRSAELEKTITDKKRIVNERLDELLDESEKVKWD